jgi:ADP-ribosyl-[dinitrogen reductase] hydrolase
MLGAIAGDIIGSRFGEGYAGPPRDFPLFHPACCFTDDSICTLAVADALLGERDFAASLRAFVRRRSTPTVFYLETIFRERNSRF